MSAVPALNVSMALIKDYVVKAANTIPYGAAVKLDSGFIVPAAADSDDAIGIAWGYADSAGHYPDNAAPAAATVQVVLFGSNAIVHALVGSGGVSAGNFGTLGASGTIVAAAAGGGTNKHVIMGQFLEAGTATEVAALNMAAGCVSVTT